MFKCFKRFTSKERVDNRRVQINLHPEGAAPVKFTKGFGIETSSSGHSDTIGFLSDVGGTGEPGLILHGSQSGSVMFNNDLSKVNKRLKPFGEMRFNNAGDLYNYVLKNHNIDLRTVGGNTPLHLISCYGTSEKSMSQQLANLLNRSVIAYGNNEMVYSEGCRGLLGKHKIKVRRFGFFRPAQKRTYHVDVNVFAELERERKLNSLYIDMMKVYKM